METYHFLFKLRVKSNSALCRGITWVDNNTYNTHEKSIIILFTYKTEYADNLAVAFRRNIVNIRKDFHKKKTNEEEVKENNDRKKAERCKV